MKTAISVPDEDFERFERAAKELGMNRSEFYRHAAHSFVESLSDGVDLTKIADAALEQAGQPSEEGRFLRESERQVARGATW